MRKLAIVTTHPVQYYAPVFKRLAQAHPDTKVFYTWGPDSIKKYDPDFKREIAWDIPLLEGYDYQFLHNISSKPGTSHFRGIINPGAFQAIHEYNPDVLLVYGWSWQSHLQIIRRFAGKKQIWFRGDSTCLDPIPRLKAFLRRQLLRWVYRHVDLAFYVGTENRKYFRCFGLQDDQLRFAPHAIDNSRFSHVEENSVRRIREELSIPESGTVILFAGKFEPKKDPFVLLEAFERIEKDDVFLLFVGNGVLEDQLKARSRKSPKSSFIRFLDFQNQSAMPAIYRASDVFCLPSAGPGETWGLAVNEAMAAGRAVLVSDKVGCAVDLVKDGNNGYIFRHREVADLAEKLSFLTKGKELTGTFGKASATMIESWSFDSQVSVILEELKKVC